MLCVVQITINRPHKRNAFRPRTVQELSLCFADARDDPDVGVVILTGAPPYLTRRTTRRGSQLWIPARRDVLPMAGSASHIEPVSCCAYGEWLSH